MKDPNVNPNLNYAMRDGKGLEFRVEGVEFRALTDCTDDTDDLESKL